MLGRKSGPRGIVWLVVGTGAWVVCLIVALGAAGDVEHARGVDNIAADADYGGFTRRVVAGGCETYANVELSEEGINRSGRVPWGLHAELIGVELVLGDFAVLGPKMSEEGEARHVAVSGIVEVVLNVLICDGVDNLRAECFVDFIIRAENGAGNDVETVDFCDLVVGESGGMIDNFLGWIERWNERSVGESCVCSWREGEDNMTMEPIPAVRRDRGGVGIELCLGGTESCVGWWVVNGRGDGSEFDGGGEGGSDGTGG